jgi:hypothetical protein
VCLSIPRYGIGVPLFFLVSPKWECILEGAVMAGFLHSASSPLSQKCRALKGDTASGY